MDELVVWFTERIIASGGVVPAFIDYFAVVVGVITGAMFACDRKLDIVGTVVCGLFTAYGGGVLRDFLLQDEGVYFMSHPYLFLLCVFLCAFVFYFRGLFRHLPSTIFLCDTLSVALYAVAGASKAFDCGSGFIMSIVLGAIVGVGGGAIRDSFVGEVPGIFRSSNFYAVAALGGSFTYVLLVQFGSDPTGAAILCVAAVLALRYLSVFFDWRTGDDPIDLTPYVSRPIKSFGYIVRGLFLGGGKRERRHYARSFRMKNASSEKAQRRHAHEEGDAGSEGRAGNEAGSNDPLAFMR
ncbi:TRIC cation channel family protein [Slackia sp.]|uniref:trimeric intracellular cation channel family protein n=1 Tax=Slackia sp. TaxID=2049041 RepID=UPI00262FF2D7|nr:TRIC cation channel family protein [Slackia sp.]